jgi:hypothetical protein
MNNLLVPFAISWLGLAVASAADEQPAAEHSHVAFQLTVRLPYEKAFPLFGAWNEQKCAAGGS